MAAIGCIGYDAEIRMSSYGTIGNTFIGLKNARAVNVLHLVEKSQIK